jgi:hypothetical protein
VKLPLFRRLPGVELDALAPSIRTLHLHPNDGCYRGEVEVQQGRGVMAALCIRALRLPAAGRGPIEVDIAIDADRERWTRHMGGRTLRSLLWEEDGLLCEQIGGLTLQFALCAQAGAMQWRAVGARWLGLPLPASAFTRVVAREYDEAGRYHFDASATLPWIGLLLRYRGWLDVG